MATQLFKGSETIWIQPHDIQNHLDIGWLLDDPNAPKRLPAGIEIINQKVSEEKTNLCAPGPGMTEAPGGMIGVLPPMKVSPGFPGYESSARKKPGRKPKSK